MQYTDSTVYKELEKSGFMERYPTVEICGDPDGYFILYARRSGNYQPVLDELVKHGHWNCISLTCVKDLEVLLGWADELGPLLRASHCFDAAPDAFPSRMAFIRSNRAVLFCNPIPEGLTLDLWYASLIRYCRSNHSLTPNIGVVAAAATAAGIGILRYSDDFYCMAISRNMTPEEFLVEQYWAVCSRLERDQTLDVFPF